MTQVERCVLALVFTFLVVATPAPGEALLIGTCNPDGPGQCTKSLSFDGSLVTIVLTNTSPAANGGFITADAFNIGAATASNFTTTDTDFVFTAGTVNVAPDGTRNALISSTNNPDPSYNGGGNPTGGIPVGGTATFTFNLSGNLTGVTEETLFGSELIRTRGFVDGGSDKDALIRQVPEPATLVFLGSSIVALGAWARRRRA